MGRQDTAVLCIVAGHMGDDGDLSARRLHHMLQCQLPVLHALVDALSRGAAHVQPFHTLFHQMRRKGLRPLAADLSVLVITRVECRDDSLIFLDIVSHILSSMPVLRGLSNWAPMTLPLVYCTSPTAAASIRRFPADTRKAMPPSDCRIPLVPLVPRMWTLLFQRRYIIMA